MSDILRAKSMFLIKSAIQCNNSMTDTVVAFMVPISTSQRQGNKTLLA